jgi:hypothetical protein
MRTLRLRPQALALCAVVVMLAGCGGSNATMSGAVPQGVTAQSRAHEARSGSWMLPEAKSEDLLYLSSDGDSEVLVYALPSGKPVGELTGIPYPVFECVDKSGDVFIASSDESAGGIYEYAHGGTTRLNFLPLNDAEGCSVDPVTGNLAVVQFSDTIYVYQNAQGLPTKYADTNFYYAADAAYDNSGNLFVDGAYRNSSFALLELPYGSNTLQNITVKPSGDYNAEDFDPILWDGKYLDLGALVDKNGIHTLVDRLQLSGSSATVAGTVTLAKQERATHPQFWIQGSEVVQPSNQPRSWFERFKYPSGKRIKRTKLDEQYDFLGAVVSVAPSHLRVRK